MQDTSLVPTSGVRVRLDREEERDADVVYRATLYLPDAVVTTRATVNTEGESIDEEALGDAPEFARAALRAFVRQLRNAHRSSGTWPRRVTRWRAEK